MALPSAVTLGGAAVVIAAGVGLAAVTTMADEEPAKQSAGTTPRSSAPTTSNTPTTPEATSTTKDRQAPADKKQKPTGPEKTKKHHRPHKQRTEAVPKVFVEVYNNSGITGLAADTAVRLEGAGWNVAATDNWYGPIPENTVYYPDGMLSEARQLAKELGYARLRPAVSPMQFDRLTVIITSA